MNKRNLTVPLIILAFLLAAATQGQVVAAPAQQGDNLLQNASFEQPFSNGVASGWSSWHMESAKTDSECLSGYHFQPKWNMETNGTNVNDAIASQYIGNNWDTWGGGVFQTVSVTPGVTYRFSFYSKGRTTSEASPATSDSSINMNIRAGIDPNGGGEWYSDSVVWGASSSPHDVWQQFSVEATAIADKMTVFTSADLGVVGTNQCRQYLDTWFDQAALVETAAPPPEATVPPAASVPPASTNTPVPQASATAEAPEPVEPQSTSEPESIAEVPQQGPSTGATVCLNAFNDLNANGRPDPNEGAMAEVTITLANQSDVFGGVITDGSENPKCFDNLEPGRFQVAQQVPAYLQMTSAANVAIEASADTTVSVLFGSRVRGEPITEAQPEDTSPGSGAEQPGETAPSSGGVVCVNAFHDENANALLDPNEGYIGGVTMLLASGSDIVGQTISTGTDTPHCFNNLEPGPYAVSQEVSDRLQPTTAESVMLAVDTGEVWQVEFGSRLQGGNNEVAGSDTVDGDSGSQDEEAADTGGFNPVAVGGLIVIALVVLVIGGVIFFLLRR